MTLLDPLGWKCGSMEGSQESRSHLKLYAELLQVYVCIFQGVNPLFIRELVCDLSLTSCLVVFYLFPRPHWINMFLNLLFWRLGSEEGWQKIGSWWNTKLFPVQSLKKSHCFCFQNTSQICHVSPSPSSNPWPGHHHRLTRANATDFKQVSLVPSLPAVI